MNGEKYARKDNLTMGAQEVQKHIYMEFGAATWTMMKVQMGNQKVSLRTK
jgi:hypothetical protein